MRIESFWAKGFRSLRDVRLEGLGAFNVFYGPNGAGKSNILEALRVLFQLARVASYDFRPPRVAHGKVTIEQGIVQWRDLCAHDPSQTIVLGARLLETRDSSQILRPAGPLDLSNLSFEVTLDCAVKHEPKLWFSMLRAGDQDLLRDTKAPIHPPGASPVQLTEQQEQAPIRGELQALLSVGLPSRGFGLIRAERSLQPEQRDVAPRGEDVLLWHLRQGRLKNALLAAQIDPRSEVRRRLNAFRALLAGPPLYRPPFDPVQDLHTGEVDLREALPEPNPEGRDISLDLAGLGIAQVYLILAQAMLLGARTIGIEEPEAHLHAPTSGRHLRQLLVRLVEEKHVDQLFIATHSNLFDLDPTGYFDVSLDKDGCTVVSRADLTRIDREHLYEPGPAKHALQRMLEYTPPEEVVFRRGDGSPVTAGEMLRLLQEDDALAVSFLQDVHGAAVRMVKVQSKKPKDAA
jgi:energy-coupling factor transporter ATP-binding protein EcfA2